MLVGGTCVWEVQAAWALNDRGQVGGEHVDGQLWMMWIAEREGHFRHTHPAHVVILMISTQ